MISENVTMTSSYLPFPSLPLKPRTVLPNLTLFLALSFSQSIQDECVLWLRFIPKMSSSYKLP
jgi:hypothetical protein